MKNDYIKWAIDTLKNRLVDAQPIHPETIISTPWSEVSRFPTENGFVYLKQVPPALSLEPHIIKILEQRYHASVPKIIADNPERHCFLMQDASMSLHDFFKQEGFQDSIFIATIQDYTALQVRTADHLDDFIKLGIPDWRLERLPVLYEQLIAEDALLRQDGLTAEELKKLKALTPTLYALCEQLSQYSIPATLSHCDFHDKNILINPQTQKTTLIDLGELVITHPFFSLLNALYMAQERFELEASRYRLLQKESLKHWMDFESEERLFDILSLIQQCWSIHALLGEYRLMTSVDSVSFSLLGREGRLAEKLRYWLEAEKNGKPSLFSAPSP